MKPTILILAVAGLGLAACGDEDTTTVINQTTITQTASSDDESSTTSNETTTASTTDDDGEDSDDDSGQVVSLKSFQTPTGNIACLMSAKSVRCDIAEKQWTAPRPAGCPKQLDFGQGLTLSAEGPAEVVCAGDTVLNPDAPVLDYGSSSRIGSITCASAESGVTCISDSGGSFTLSREAYELN